jgi:hypothetical protein
MNKKLLQVSEIDEESAGPLQEALSKLTARCVYDVCVCVCVCLCVCVCVCVLCVCKIAQLMFPECVFLCMDAYTHQYADVYVVCLLAKCICECLHYYVCICVDTYTCMRVSLFIPAHTCTYIHSYIHTYILAFSLIHIHTRMHLETNPIRRPGYIHTFIHACMHA